MAQGSEAFKLCKNRGFLRDAAWRGLWQRRAKNCASSDNNSSGSNSSESDSVNGKTLPGMLGNALWRCAIGKRDKQQQPASAEQSDELTLSPALDRGEAVMALEKAFKSGHVHALQLHVKTNQNGNGLVAALFLSLTDCSGHPQQCNCHGGGDFVKHSAFPWMEWDFVDEPLDGKADWLPFCRLGGAEEAAVGDKDDNDSNDSPTLQLLLHLEWQSLRAGK